MPCPSKLEGGWWWWWVRLSAFASILHFAHRPPDSTRPRALLVIGAQKEWTLSNQQREGTYVLKFWRICCETFYPLEKFDVKFVTVQTNFLGPNLTQFLLLENTSEAVRSRSDGLIQILLLRKFWACIDRDYTPPCVLLGYFDTEKGSRSILEKLI